MKGKTASGARTSHQSVWIAAKLVAGGCLPVSQTARPLSKEALWARCCGLLERTRACFPAMCGAEGVWTDYPRRGEGRDSTKGGGTRVGGEWGLGALTDARAEAGGLEGSAPLGREFTRVVVCSVRSGEMGLLASGQGGAASCRG